jgi:hypothetical protein
VVEVLHLAMSKKCAEGAIDRFYFFSRGHGRNYVFHANQFLRL